MGGMTEAHVAGQRRRDHGRRGAGRLAAPWWWSGPDGRPVGTMQTDERAGGEDPARLIEQPAKVMRIGSMIKQLLEEVKAAPLDEASRHRLREIHERSIVELEDGLAPELRDELERLSLPFAEEARPRARRSCGSPRPSWSAGWKGCSTASRPRWWPSRWRPGCSWSRCVPAAGRPAQRPRRAGAGHPRHAGQPGRRRRATAPASTSDRSIDPAGTRARRVEPAQPTPKTFSRYAATPSSRGSPRSPRRRSPATAGCALAMATAAPGPGQHRHVVGHVTEGDHVGRGRSRALAVPGQPGGLGDPGGGDLHQPAEYDECVASASPSSAPATSCDERVRVLRSPARASSFTAGAASSSSGGSTARIASWSASQRSG